MRGGRVGNYVKNIIDLLSGYIHIIEKPHKRLWAVNYWEQKNSSQVENIDLIPSVVPVPSGCRPLV